MNGHAETKRIKIESCTDQTRKKKIKRRRLIRIVRYPLTHNSKEVGESISPQTDSVNLIR